jgi:hypothetical protein
VVRLVPFAAVVVAGGNGDGDEDLATRLAIYKRRMNETTKPDGTAKGEVSCSREWGAAAQAGSLLRGQHILAWTGRGFLVKETIHRALLQRVVTNGGSSC